MIHRVVIKVEYRPLPGTDRRYDWCAVDTNSYDADCDERGYFTGCAMGHGMTRRDAVLDLVSQWDDE